MKVSFGDIFIANMKNQSFPRFVAFITLFLFGVALLPEDATAARFDFDGDGRADVAVFRRSERYNWYIQKSTGGHETISWGLYEDKPVPADYDGDGRTDVAVHRSSLAMPGMGNWWILPSDDFSYIFINWSSSNIGDYDYAAQADYDGDGIADVTYYRISDYVGSQSYFYIRQSSDSSTKAIPWGIAGDRHVPADYDGDGKADVAIYRNGQWWILQSSNGEVRIETFGLQSDRVVPGDYDGDGKADIAVWRPSGGIWFCRSSLTGEITVVQFGLSDDKPVADDYDGDGKTDIAVWRPSTGMWFIINSSNSTISYHRWGLDGDLPVQNTFVR